MRIPAEVRNGQGTVLEARHPFSEGTEMMVNAAGKCILFSN